MASSSSSSSITCQKSEVFVNFRGSDVRVGFLSHFLKALAENDVDAFVDEELERGEEISSSLLEIIEGSSISIVIFSENYADSVWCLDELVLILECKKRSGQIVIPVFYGLDPTHVQELTGSFGHALSKHRQDINQSYKVENWCQALNETSILSGFVSSNFKSDSELIEEIIRHILEKLNHLFPSDCSHEEGLVGIGSRIKNVLSLLCREDVRVVGIWGEGGIGKTTLARKVFEQISGQFESHCFVANVRERYEKDPDILQNQLHSKLLGLENSDMGNYIMASSFKRRRLSRMKVLIVLDDVSDFDQIKSLMGKPVDYGSGSRIIVTSRDKQLLKNADAEIYEVEKLNEREALELFCLRTFRRNIPEEGFTELSERVIEYAQGLPLVLEVLGCNLHSKSLEEWKDELEYLKGASDKKIHKILRRSYDGLSDNEKKIFLDIACFFRWEDRDYVESMLNDPGSKIGISCLVDKSVISISSENRIHMHDLIQQMAKDIICEEKNLKKRSILWNPKEICYMLSEEKGTGAIRGISLDMSKIRGISLSPKAFERMYNLRYLKFHNSFYICSNNIKVYLPQGLEFLPDELRYLCWCGYPLKSLPLSFCAEKLVEIDMPYSDLEELWNGVQNLANLKRLNLCFCKKLIKISDLSRALNLEDLILIACKSLIEIPSSVKYLSKLTKLNLIGCSGLCRLPSCLHLISLEYLYLRGCSEVTDIPNIPCYERHPRNAIEKAPSSFGIPFQLRKLLLDGCSRIESLPDCICNLIYLIELSIEDCINLFQLPENLGNLKNLEELTANRSGIHQLPDSICNLKYLKILRVDDCFHLRRLPQNLGNLKNLNELAANGIKEVPSSINCLRNLEKLNLEGCGILEFPNSVCSLTSLRYLYLAKNYFESIPESIKQLSCLMELDLRDCTRLKHLAELPVSLGRLHARNCTSLESASVESSLVRHLDFGNCINLDRKQLSKIIDHGLNPNLLFQQLIPCLMIITPGSEVPQKMKYQNKSGSSLSFSFQLQQQTDSLWFYLCAVLDPQVCEFWDGEVSDECQVDLIDKESNCCIASEKSRSSEESAVYQLKHTFLHIGGVFGHMLVKGHEYTVVFNFHAIEIIRNPKYFNLGRIEGCRSYDAIIECGVHPKFDHVLIDQEKASRGWTKIRKLDTL